MNWQQLVRYVCAGAAMAAFCSVLLLTANAVIHPDSSLGQTLVIGVTYFVSSATNYVVQKRAVFRATTAGSISQMTIFMLCSGTLSIAVGHIGTCIETQISVFIDIYANSTGNFKGIAGLCLATCIAAPVSFQITRRLVA